MTARADLHRRFTLLLLEAMGLASVAGAAVMACGGNVVVDTAGAGGSDGGGGSGGSGATSTTTSNSTGSGCIDPGWGEPVDVCVEMSGDACPIGDAAALQAAAQELGVCAEINEGDCCNAPNVHAVLCEWPPTGTSCCYTVAYNESGLCIGRPFTVGGTARSAALAGRADWSRGAAPSCDDLDPHTRRALADAWAADARAEHASVASFARLALELLAVGAPPELVRGAQRAMGDEIRHAEMSFALASAYGGAPVGPGPLAIEGVFSRTTLAGVAAAAVREGCIGESIAALLAAEARDAASDAAVRAALAAIALEEAEHAALSWKIVAWALRTGDCEVRAAITGAFEGASMPVVAAAPSGADAAALRAHGRLAPAEIRDVAARALAEVVAPAFASLRASVSAGG
jgi:hypothetical protein